MPCLLETCAGSAAVSLAAFGGVPPAGYRGGKRRHAHHILRLMGIQAGLLFTRDLQIVLTEPELWGRARVDRRAWSPAHREPIHPRGADTMEAAMKQPDLFSAHATAPIPPAWARNPMASHRPHILAGRHPFGRELLQPAGEHRCGGCAHLQRIVHAKTYYKCALARQTAGRATDVRLRWPACEAFATCKTPAQLVDDAMRGEAITATRENAQALLDEVDGRLCGPGGPARRPIAPGSAEHAALVAVRQAALTARGRQIWQRAKPAPGMPRAAWVRQVEKTRDAGLPVPAHVLAAAGLDRGGKIEATL